MYYKRLPIMNLITFVESKGATRINGKDDRDNKAQILKMNADKHRIQELEEAGLPTYCYQECTLRFVL